MQKHIIYWGIVKNLKVQKFLNEDSYKRKFKRQTTSKPFLFVADNAALTRDSAWEDEALTLGFDASEKAGDLEVSIVLHPTFNESRARKKTRSGRQEHGKLKIPTEFPWYKESALFVARTPTTQKREE